MQEYVLRSKTPPLDPLNFALARDGHLGVGAAQPLTLKVLRREPNGWVTVLWGQRIISGVVCCQSDRADTLQLTVDGRQYTAQLREAMLDAMEQKLAAAAGAAGTLEINSPIPGLVKAVLVKPGDSVTAGQTIIVLEAMKMENEIAAPHDGKVAAVEVKPGQTVAAGAALARIDA
jgi:biotin carboxyl carrier protein